MRVKISSDGFITGVEEVDSGAEILVSRIELTQQAGKPVECKLVLSPTIELEIEADAELMCGAVAVEICIWPDGRAIPVCQAHAGWAASILRTLGHSYNSRPAKPEEICTQKIQEK